MAKALARQRAAIFRHEPSRWPYLVEVMLV
jgi:hypothetical protein